MAPSTHPSSTQSAAAPLPHGDDITEPRFARGAMSHPIQTTRPWERPEAGDGLWRESWTSRLTRRAISVPILFVIAGIYLVMLPLLLAVGAITDLVRRRPWLAVRFHLLMFGVLFSHVIGLIGLFFIWVASLRWLGVRRASYERWNLGLERWWGNMVIALGEVIYGMKVHVTGAEVLAPGPVVVFCRHTSIIDTMLPLRLVENWHWMVARIIKKRELLWDPCVDSISQRLPRTFVRRGSSDHSRQVEMVRQITGGMGSDDVLWMYPEGTRFTAKKQKRVFDKLRERHPEALERARQFRYTLPPRPGGTLALLEQCEGMDVVFCAHTGMEGANRLENFLAGSLYKRHIHIELWRVPASEIPTGREERLEWMEQQWLRVDRWVQERQDPDITELLRHE